MATKKAPKANRIVTFWHCRKCVEQLPQGESPRSYAQIEVGWTPEGFQAWCKRHEENIGDFDLCGNKVKVL